MTIVTKVPKFKEGSKLWRPQTYPMNVLSTSKFCLIDDIDLAVGQWRKYLSDKIIPPGLKLNQLLKSRRGRHR